MRYMKKQAKTIFSLQSGKYIAAASVGYVFDLSLLIFLHSFLELNYNLSATGGFIIGLIIQYVLSNRYVFGESKLSKKSYEITSFAAIGVVGLLILNVLMFVFITGLHINYIVAKILATIFVYIWNFLARRALYNEV